MGGEVHPQLFQLGTQGAGVGMAGFFAVTDQNDGGLALAVLELLGGHTHGGRNRRHALGLQGVDRLLHGSCIHRGRHLEYFNICAIALAAVTIGHQTELLVARPGFEHGADRFAGDFNLGAPLDLPPHGARRIKHQHGHAGATGHGHRLLGRSGKHSTGSQCQGGQRKAGFFHGQSQSERNKKFRTPDADK